MRDLFFVDDLIGGAISLAEGIELLKKLKLRFIKRHFLLRTWRTDNFKLRERNYVNTKEVTKDDKCVRS